MNDWLSFYNLYFYNLYFPWICGLLTVLFGDSSEKTGFDVFQYGKGNVF